MPGDEVGLIFMGLLSQTFHLVYKFLIFLSLCLLWGWGDGALVLESYIFFCLTEGNTVVCSGFWGER